jgi:hypothetical protein
MGKVLDVEVTIRADGIHVDKEIVRVPFKAANAEIVWTIVTDGWWFTHRGIEIEQGEGVARLLHRRDRHLLDLFKAARKKDAKKILDVMEADYDRFVMTGGRQFHSPQNQGARFRWVDYNDYRELYKYSIEVTNGSTTMRLDPAIKNQGC